MAVVHGAPSHNLTVARARGIAVEVAGLNEASATLIESLDGKAVLKEV